MYEFWYDYVKPKFGQKQNCVIWIQIWIIVYIKTNDIYKGIAEDVELDLILQIMNYIDHYLQEKIKK